MSILDVSNLVKSFGSSPILDGLTFSLDAGDKVGIVGRNGCGKSTLFRILAGLMEPDGGQIARRRGITIGYLPQRPALNPAHTIREALALELGTAREKLDKWERLGREIAHAGGMGVDGLLKEQEELQGWLDHHGGWNLDHRVKEICARLGIADPDAVIGTLSGGWSQRVALAGILLNQPDILILDEPTNQLDARTVEWLEEQLSGYPGALLLVTHDRYFLDRVVGRMFELDGGRITSYAGGYSSYLEQKAIKLAQHESSQSRILNLLRREEEWLRRGAKARTTKQKARIDRVGELRTQKDTTVSRDLAMDFGGDKRLGATVIDAVGLTVGMGGRVLVKDLDLRLQKGDRVGILGPNGCGKTTLVRALLGELAPISGTVTVGKNTKVAYLDQERTGLDEAQSVEDSLCENEWVMLPDGQKRHRTGYLEGFLFTRVEQKKPVSTLSGGERARLLLAKMILEGANVLVLDEPTNDLDIPTLQVLDEALGEFPGCVLMVTHDRYFLDRVATGILHFEESEPGKTTGRVVAYEGNYETFLRLSKPAPAPAKPSDEPAKEPAKPAQKPRQGLSYKEKQELSEVEEKIALLEERKAGLESMLADPSRLAGGHEELKRLAGECGELETSLAALMERWEELEGKK